VLNCTDKISVHGQAADIYKTHNSSRKYQVSPFLSTSFRIVQLHSGALAEIAGTSREAWPPVLTPALGDTTQSFNG
jgi:hypothetical protein